MNRPRSGSVWGRALPGLIAVLAMACAAPAIAQPGFPDIPVWSYAGAYQNGPDSVRAQPRTITVRFLRDPAAEARSDFGGYRIYRVFNSPDSSRMTLIRRYSLNHGDSLLMWHFPPITQPTPASFIDPDSAGNFVKVCAEYDTLGRCTSIGDSVYALIPPPGPHDGFRTWYAITYEAKNSAANNYEDLFVPDPDCAAPPNQCPNLNHKLANLTTPEIEATPGPAQNLETVSVVPNPFRAAEAWDLAGGHEVHFINLPTQARIRIYTSSGDLVRELEHNDPVRDFARWDLKNGSGEDVASGIYMFRVESANFSAQSRFIVIR